MTNNYRVNKHISPYTKEENAARAREWRKKNPGYVPSGKIAKYPKELRPLLSQMSVLRGSAKSRAKKRDIPFDSEFMERDSLYELYVSQDGKCAISGIPLSTTKHDPWVLSIDQINPGLGYIKGNVQFICWAVNRAKGDLNDEEFHKLCRSVIGRCNDHLERE